MLLNGLIICGLVTGYGRSGPLFLRRLFPCFVAGTMFHNGGWIVLVSWAETTNKVSRGGSLVCSTVGTILRHHVLRPYTQNRTEVGFLTGYVLFQNEFEFIFGKTVNLVGDRSHRLDLAVSGKCSFNTCLGQAIRD